MRFCGFRLMKTQGHVGHVQLKGRFQGQGLSVDPASGSLRSFQGVKAQNKMGAGLLEPG